MKSERDQSPVPAVADKKIKACQACGRQQDLGRRKYCSAACRQRLVNKLNITTNLLRAMHTRYAAFSFTQETLVLHVVVSGSRQVHSFLWRRNPKNRPADDLGHMNEALGRAWWEKKREKGSRHQAALTVLGRARSDLAARQAIRPQAKTSPKVNKRLLTVLQLSEKELLADDVRQRIQTAFRRQAIAHHPDHQGDAALFRKIHQAYVELLDWARAPSMKRGSLGLPGKWCYSGKGWVPPKNA